MKNAFAIVTLSALLSACAIAPPTPQADAVAPAPLPAADAAPAAPVAPVASAAVETLPGVELTSDLLYRITKAELEFKRGQWQGPFVTMLALAQQTRDPRLARRAAEMALTAKQGPEALAAIRLWRTLAPDSDEATQYFLGFAVVNDDLGEAEQIFSQRLAAAPPAARAMAMFQMQQFLLRAKDKAAAFGLQQRVLAPYADVPESHLILAQGAFAVGDSQRARAEAEAALALKPDSELAILTKAQVAPDVDAAVKVMTDFLVAHPQGREVRAAYARILVDAKQYDAARQQFLMLLKDQPDNLATLYALGVVAMQSNDMAGAEQYFKQFVAVQAQHPGDERDPSKVLMILAQIEEDRGDFGAAIGWLEKVDSNENNLYLSARLKRAQLTARKGDVEEARKQLTDLHTEDPAEIAQIIQTDAQLLRDAGNHRAAFHVLENGVKRLPDNPDLLYDYALVAEKLGHLDVMERSLRAVIAAAPNNQHAYNALGYSLAERNERLTEAFALIDKALQMAPGDPFIMDSMGWVQFRLGRLAEAEDLLRRAYALRSDPEIAVHLGEVLWVKGDQAGAQKMWQEAQRKDPTNDALKSTLTRLNQSL
ncbi:MAG: tetratricopeptide repeat protein [Sphingomonadaceae bacterium]